MKNIVKLLVASLFMIFANTAHAEEVKFAPKCEIEKRSVKALQHINISRMFPIYAVDHEINGKVNVLLEIDENGDVINSIIMESDQAGIFDETVVRRTKNIKFEPEIYNCKPIKSYLSMKIVFILN